MQPIENHSQTDGYITHVVRSHAPDLYLLALFVPAAHRPQLLVIYALAAELAHIPRMVTEEMLGHIRYAWWRETLQSLYSGTPRHGHPVLEAMPELIGQGLLPEDKAVSLVEAYAETYPELSPNEHPAIAALTLHYLEKTCPEAQKPWQKAQHILINHRAKHGPKRHSWLMLKLLLAGLTR